MVRIRELVGRLLWSVPPIMQRMLMMTLLLITIIGIEVLLHMCWFSLKWREGALR